MKKNKMMRSASALLVMTLLTTSVISGTFAKYTTAASATDTARVAKWGVTVGTSGKLFDTQYAEDDTTTDTIAYSVIADDNTSVVAPGTKNADGITFTITGTPEVAVDVEVKVTGANSAETATDIYLKTGKYADLTTGTSSATVNGTTNTNGDKDILDLTSDYYPVVYTLKDDQGNELVTNGRLSDVEAYLENLSGRYPANTNLATGLGSNSSKSTNGSYVLTWAWVYNENDAADTLLGNLAADSSILAKGDGTSEFTELTATTDYNLQTTVAVSIKVTQVD